MIYLLGTIRLFNKNRLIKLALTNRAGGDKHVEG